MPELPEVESLRRILARSATGLTIVSAKVLEPRLRRKVSHDFEAAIAGRRIEALARRAKYLILELAGGDALLVHLGMSGSLTHRPGKAGGPHLPTTTNRSIRPTTTSSFVSTTAAVSSTTIRAASAC